MKNMSFEEILAAVEKKGERVVPGLMKIDNQKVMYFEDDGSNPVDKQFDNLTNFATPTNANSGGVNIRGCAITTPNSNKYHALSFHGDLIGWEKDLLARVKVLNISLAVIQDERLVIDNGQSYLLNECEIEFY